MIETKRENTVISIYRKYSGIIVVALLGLLIYFVVSNLEANHRVHDMRDRLTKEREVFSVWKDSVGREHAKIKIVTEYIEALQPAIAGKLDTAARVLKIAQNDIKTLTEATSSAKGNVTTRVDTNRTFHFNDGYFSMDGSYKDSTLEGSYTYTDRIHYVTYEKKKKFLGITVKREKFLDVYFDNPKTSITNLETVELSKYTKPKRWGIGPSLGVTYHTNKVQPYIGIGVNYNLIRW